MSKKRNKPKDMIGKKYGLLTVLSIDPVKRKHHERVLLCRCDCGQTTETITSHLTMGNTGSCGCRSKYPVGIGARNTLVSRYKSSARRRNIIFSLTNEELFRLVELPCHYCDREKTQEVNYPRANGVYKHNGIDRIDSNQGYTLENTVPCCKMCNYMKLDWEYSEFLEQIQRIYKKKCIPGEIE